MPKLHLSIVLLPVLLASSAFANDVNTMQLPEIIQDEQKYSHKDFSGEWIAYWFDGSRFEARTNTTFFLKEDGKWQTQVKGGELEDSGTFEVSDSHIRLRPTGKDGEILGALINKDNFILKSESNPARSVVYRRSTGIPRVSHEDVSGKWRFFSKPEKPDDKPKESPFYILFDGNGKYKIEKIKKDFSIPPEVEKGEYELEEDRVILKNEFENEDSVWHNLEFILCFDELIFNDPAMPYWGEKVK